MKITTKQAAEILGIAGASVRLLIKNGKLKDYATRTEGANRHNAALDIKEIREFKQNYVPRPYMPRKMKTVVVDSLTNGIPINEFMAGQDMGRVVKLLESINNNLAQLIQLWK